MCTATTSFWKYDYLCITPPLLIEEYAKKKNGANTLCGLTLDLVLGRGLTLHLADGRKRLDLPLGSLPGF